MSATPQHSKVGASTAERWWNCPGSVREVAKLPPQPSSSYADEGTVAHLVAERCLREKIDASEYVGRVARQMKNTKTGDVFFSFTGYGFDEEPTGEEIEVTDEMAEAVQVYLDVIREDMAKYHCHPDDLKVEHKFHLAHIDPTAFGTNDANLPIFLTKVIVYDYKHGQGKAVDAIGNKQAQYYAVGARYGEDYDEIEVVIVQPRAPHKDGPVRRWSQTRAQIDAFEAELKAKIAETKKPDAPVVAGSWCEKSFCPAMASCPAVRKKVETAAMVVFKETTPVTFPQPETLTPMMLKQLLDLMPTMDAWLKALWSYAEEKANRGEPVLGYKLVRGREGNRKWYDETAVSATLLLKYPEDKIFDRKLKSPAQLEKALGKEVKPLMPTLTTRSEGRIILVPEDDPREVVQSNVTEVFAIHAETELIE